MLKTRVFVAMVMVINIKNMSLKVMFVFSLKHDPIGSVMCKCANVQCFVVPSIHPNLLHT